MAQLTTTEKSEISHRGNAIKKLNAYLESEKFITKTMFTLSFSSNHSRNSTFESLSSFIRCTHTMPEKGKTMAQLTTTEKSEISHRGNAIKKLNAYLEFYLFQAHRK
jgi:hypothetical protein